MDSNSGFTGVLYMISEWVMRIAVTNLLWIVFNLPIVFILLNILFVERIEDLVPLMIPLVIFMPFIFYPATMAMYASVRGWIIKKEDHEQLIKPYWRYYKENYKRSMFAGLILTMIWIILAVDIYFFLDKNINMLYFFIVLGVIFFVYSMNFFSVTVHYQMKLFASLKHTLMITIGRPLLFITVLISSLVILYFSFDVFTFLLPFFTGSLVAWLTFAAFYRNYQKLVIKSN